MKVPTSIYLLVLSGVIGALASDDNNVTDPQVGNLYILDDNDIPVKVDLSATTNEPIIDSIDLPNYVSYYLFTRNTKNKPEKLKIGDVASLRSSQFDPKKPTKFITHGWVNSRLSKACTLVRDAFLLNGDYNVIVVDWSHISRKPYSWACIHVVKIAKLNARMIEFLQSEGMDVSKVTFVGHSLGAHIAGLSSHYAKDKVNFVVALDPAGPGFYGHGPNTKVTKEDATYVEVIHTSRILGIHSSLGHADFYPNGGFSQKGCLIDMGGSCSHARSYHYYAESINSGGFLARSCNNFHDYLNGKCNSNSIVRMGGIAPNFNITGVYYLSTNLIPPYAKNEV